MSNPQLKSAVEDLETLSKDLNARALYEAEMKFVRDVNSRVQTMWERGEAEGLAKGKAEVLAEGEAKGKAEGRTEAAIKAALALKIENIPLSTIVKATGLTKEEIENL